MKLRKMAAVGVLLVITLTLLPIPMVQALPKESSVYQETGTNLLANPGLEGLGKPSNNNAANWDNWTRDTFNGAAYGEIFTPQGWVTWWQEGEYKRPECKVIPNEHPFDNDPARIHTGYYAGMCFTFFGKQNAGYYQVVKNIPAGATVQASAYAHAWASNEDKPYSSGDPFSFSFQVGIDPNGGTDPFSSSVIWSNPVYHYDTFGLVGPLQATVGPGGVATIFTRAHAKWSLKHNDAYWDDISLVLLTPGETATPTSPPPPPTAEGPIYTATPRPQPTPRPDGAVVHIVESGDTLFGLAIEYGVETDELRRLNAGTLGPNDMLSIGDEIIISIPGGQAQPQPTATPAAEQPVAATQEPGAQPTQDPNSGNTGTTPATPAGDTAAICITAYHDRNGDMFRQSESEEMLPNSNVNVVGTSGPAGDYVTDGMSEPYCFQNLQPGNYILRHTPPAGYKLTDAGQWNIPLSAGQVSSLELAYVRDENAATDATGEQGGDTQPNTPAQPVAEGTQEAGESANVEQQEPEENSSPVTNILNTVIKVSGIFVAILAIGVAVLFFISRQRM
ncbi:MAG: LysM peptidoglycan-binding domain-containing protein [Anaerolineae bacterium]|nr:LysM peptidoglycan-binding domain-containing protein [Anaerolineae bacterium]